jgi:hypothetical protein
LTCKNCFFFEQGNIPFGLAHFQYVENTASLVPKWLPAHVALAYFTGAAFIAAGVAVPIGVWGRLAAALSALQMGTFLLLVWVPAAATRSPDRFQWGEVLVTWVLTAAGWVVADSHRGIPWLAMDKPLAAALRQTRWHVITNPDGDSVSEHAIDRSAHSYRKRRVSVRGNIRALVWQNNIPTDLNSLIPADTPWYLLTAASINDVGEIVGWAVNTNTFEVHAVLASPIAGIGPAAQGATKPPALPAKVHTSLRRQLHF